MWNRTYRNPDKAQKFQLLQQQQRDVLSSVRVLGQTDVVSVQDCLGLFQRERHSPDCVIRLACELWIRHASAPQLRQEIVVRLRQRVSSPWIFIKKEKEEERDLSRCLFSSLLLHLYLFFHASKLYSILRIIELFVNVTYRSWNLEASRFVGFFPPSNVINDTRVGRQLDCSNVEN